MHPKTKLIRVYITVSVVAFAICIAVAASAFYVIVCWRKKPKPKHCLSCKKSVDLELQQLSLSVRTASEKKVSFESSSQMESLDDHILPTTPRKVVAAAVESYTVEELSNATAEFSSANLIEGSVYHGRLKGKNVAVKCTDPDTVSKIKFELFQSPTRFHPNIIRLLGFCIGDGTGKNTMTIPTRKEFLVFEYAKNGSLKDWIHGGLAMKSHFIASCSCFLNWNQRLKICLDVANALQYMHQALNPSYVHGNIKSRNIFLDEEFRAKVGNFGMEECVRDHSYLEEVPSSGYLYSSFPETWDEGYIAPEYSNSGVIGPSVDIYAFGVVLLEILSGKLPIRRGKSENDDGCRLSENVKVILDSVNVTEMVTEWMDNALTETYSFEAVMVLVNLARDCVEDDPSLRPTAGEVVVRLAELAADGGEEQAIVRESSCRPLVAQPFAIKDVNDF